MNYTINSGLNIFYLYESDSYDVFKTNAFITFKCDICCKTQCPGYRGEEV